MDFDVNSLAEKAKESLNVVANATERVINVQLTNIEILNIEAKLDKAYGQLGREYYKGLKTENSEKVKAAENKVKNILNELAALKEELEMKKNLKNCPKCHKAIDIKASFCEYCGEKFE